MSNVTNNDKSQVGEAYWDKYSIPRVPLAEALWQLEVGIRHGQKRGVFCLISDAGEGKSQGVHGVLRKLGYTACDIRTAQLTHVGAGVPQRGVDGYFEYAVPADFPKPGEKKAMVFDEVNQGQPHAIALVFKILEDRGIYGWKLPDDCPVILMMNPGSGAYSVTKIETNPAINRRVKKFYVFNTFGDWKKHAVTEDFHHTDGMDLPCHPWVVKFLTTTPNMLYTARDRDSNKQFCSPATWQTVSLDLYIMEREGIEIADERVETRIAATINTVNAKALCDYIRNNEIRISPDEVLQKYKAKSKLRERVLQMQKEPGGDYIRLVEALAHHLFDEKPPAPEVAPQLVRFWADMPNEQAQAFYSHLGNAADKGVGGSRDENIAYMQALTVELQNDPLWDELNARINNAHDDFERGLTGSDASPDPMR